MTLPTYETVVWLISIVVHLLLVGYMLSRRAAGRFPIVFSLLAVESATSPLLYVLHPYYFWYFYVFWTIYPIKILLKFAILADVLRTIPDLRFTSREKVISFATVGISLVGLTVYSAVRGSYGWKPAIAGVLFNIDHAVAFLWLALPLLAYFVLGVFQSGWNGRGLRVGAGILASAVISLGASYAVIIDVHKSILVDAIQTLPLCATWVFIVWAIAGPEPKPFVLTQEIQEEYKRLRDQYIL
jgi:hypothetical protein